MSEVHVCAPASKRIVFTWGILEFLQWGQFMDLAEASRMSRGRLTPGCALGDISPPLTPSIISKSKSVREAETLKASSLSVRSGRLATKTF